MATFRWQILLLLTFAAFGEQHLLFLGRRVTVSPNFPDDDFFPKAQATVCVEGEPRFCYTTPDKVGGVTDPSAIEYRKGESGLLLQTATGGVSSLLVRYALLRPSGTKLEDLLGVEVSNQSQYEFWSEPSISEAKIFVVADFVWGPDESHYDSHRYVVSTYVLSRARLNTRYYLDDEFMTSRKYDLNNKVDILAAEKPEILARLRRVVRDNPPALKH